MNIISVPLKEYIDKYTADDTDFFTVHSTVVKIAIEQFSALIAGGSLRRLITNTPISEGDIDLYNTKRRNSVLERFLRNTNDGYRYTTASLKLNDKLQLINGVYTKGPEHIFSTYDFSVCCFATDLKTLWGTEQAFEDVKGNVLHLNKMYKKYPRLPKRYRLDKYKKLGYTLSNEIIGMLYEDFTNDKPKQNDVGELELTTNDPYEDWLLDLSEIDEKETVEL